MKYFKTYLAVFALFFFADANSQKLIDQDNPLLKAQVFAQDVIVQGSECVGMDCNNGESFGFDTGRYKENNLRLHFDDTSNSGSFPSNDWRFTFNDSSNGGANYFKVEDVTAGTSPLTISAGAGNNAIYVSNSGGNVGLGTASPVVELHVADGDTPTLRLEQNGASGFTPQTWDVAGNETNFFIRDVNNGSQLPFRIFPGTGNESAIVIKNSKVGIFTNDPTDATVHIRKTDASTTELRIQNVNASDQTINVRQQNNTQEWNSQIRGNNNNFRIRNVTGNATGMEINSTNNAVTMDGELTANGVTLTSDLRLKTNIKPFTSGLSIVNKLNPISYNFNGVTNYDQERVYYSIGAQELQEVAPYLVHNFTYEHEDRDGNILDSKEYLKIDFSAMTWVLVNSVKEQQVKIEKLEEEVKAIDELKATIAELQAQMESLLEKTQQDVTVGNQSRLMQNYPNPHEGKTTIEYFSTQSQSAQIQLTDLSGKLIKTMNLEPGLGQVNLSSQDLPVGQYNYSLIVDGQVVDTKKMMIAR